MTWYHRWFQQACVWRTRGNHQGKGSHMRATPPARTRMVYQDQHAVAVGMDAPISRYGRAARLAARRYTSAYHTPVPLRKALRKALSYILRATTQGHTPASIAHIERFT